MIFVLDFGSFHHVICIKVGEMVDLFVLVRKILFKTQFNAPMEGYDETSMRRKEGNKIDKLRGSLTNLLINS